MFDKNTIQAFVVDQMPHDASARADVLADFAVATPDHVDEARGLAFYTNDNLARIFGTRLDVNALIHQIISEPLSADFTTARADRAAILNRDKAGRLRGIENEINGALAQGFVTLTQDSAWIDEMRSIFEEESWRVYEAMTATRENKEWQKPKWQPHEVHMRYLERVWESAQPILAKLGLELDQPLREGFGQSREKEITETDHNRRFFGVLLERVSRRPVLYFELDVPHSHAEVAYTTPPTVRLSYLNDGDIIG